MMDNVVDTLLELERAGWDSLCDSTGSEFYGATMLAEAVMVLANGMVMDRQTVVNALSESPPWRTYEISDVRCIRIDEDNAALVYTGTGYRDGTEPAFRGAMSSVYHRTGDSWRLALYQQTSMAATLST
ncbi:hypothetical protein ASE48_06155 [Mycobacterium sp. Root265]|uniref:nuclear transport factor 2 family protein n=1 Tax=Mycobacterium sp. Root265 TaxID=1736504 RepID=UPI0007104214|nr:nuclear transport factor 2 family protein [Mycobacterium sp. Root265]KRD09611.1 hypothetical protein ASE48_06155 [Mycobacterium sp. Root265]